jgi:hypothetical protein
MTILIIAGLVWVIMAGFILLVLCVNSSRLSKIEEPFKDYSLKARPSVRKLSQGERAPGERAQITVPTSGD